MLVSFSQGSMWPTLSAADSSVLTVVVPTAILSSQTGFNEYTFLDLTSEMNNYSKAWQNLNLNIDTILLKEKETLSMWCFSDRFFRKHNLKGFHTGMIISEVDEAKFMLGYSPLNKVELYENMVNLAKILYEKAKDKQEKLTII